MKIKQGRALVGVTDNKLCALYLIEEDPISALSKVLQRQWKYSTVVENQQLIDSLSEKLNNFDFTRENGLSLLLKGTPFQTEVWENLINIPSGETRSYQDLADLIPESSARAVGGAVARNEISVILPCHRVIHNNGDIGNYRWGRKCKARIIRLEKGDYNEGFFPEF